MLIIRISKGDNKNYKILENVDDNMYFTVYLQVGTNITFYTSERNILKYFCKNIIKMWKCSKHIYEI